MAQPKLSVAAGAAVEAVESAFNKYSDWSEYEWLEDAPESFLQMEMANAFSDKCRFVTVETSVRYIERYSGCKIHGNAIGKRKRIDIVMWNSSGYPNYLCEIKKLGQISAVEADGKRITKIMKYCDSIQYGLLVVYASNKYKETIENKFNKIQKNLDMYNLHGKKIINYEEAHDWHWGAACFFVKGNDIRNL